jgi:hypothetical protein
MACHRDGGNGLIHGGLLMVEIYCAVAGFFGVWWCIEAFFSLRRGARRHRDDECS